MSHELKTGGERGYLRIATEEAFATREQIDCYLRMVKDGSADRGMMSLWGFYARSPSERATLILERIGPQPPATFHRVIIQPELVVRRSSGGPG